ncbi:MAG: hypothetical protein ABI693_03350 [Bryobacteraceae bacterium]
MRTLVEKVEALDAKLRIADPGDVATLASLLEQRGTALACLPRLCATGEGNPELLQRLQAISQGMSGLYRGVILERLLIVQRQSALEREKALLKSVSGILDPPRHSVLVNEEG